MLLLAGNDNLKQSDEAKALIQNLSSAQKDEIAKKEEENAARVDALLMELFPDRADLFRRSQNDNASKAISSSKSKASEAKKALGMVAKLKVRLE